MNLAGSARANTVSGQDTDTEIKQRTCETKEHISPDIEYQLNNIQVTLLSRGVCLPANRRVYLKHVKRGNLNVFVDFFSDAS